MRNFLVRFSEPSSWAGLAAVLAATGVGVAEGLMQPIIYTLSGIAGLIAFFVPEKKQ